MLYPGNQSGIFNFDLVATDEESNEEDEKDHQ